MTDNSQREVLMHVQGSSGLGNRMLWWDKVDVRMPCHWLYVLVLDALSNQLVQLMCHPGKLQRHRTMVYKYTDLSEDALRSD